MVIVNVPLFSYFGNKDNEIDIIKDNIPDLNNYIKYFEITQ